MTDDGLPVPPHRPHAWRPTHRFFFTAPSEGHVDVMFIPNRDDGRDGYTHLDWSTHGGPEFSVTNDGEWRREGLPFVGRVELLGRLGDRSLDAG